VASSSSSFPRRRLKDETKKMYLCICVFATAAPHLCKNQKKSKEKRFLLARKQRRQLKSVFFSLNSTHLLLFRRRVKGAFVAAFVVGENAK